MSSGPGPRSTPGLLTRRQPVCHAARRTGTISGRKARHDPSTTPRRLVSAGRPGALVGRQRLERQLPPPRVRPGPTGHGGRRLPAVLPAALPATGLRPADLRAADLRPATV